MYREKSAWKQSYHFFCNKNHMYSAGGEIRIGELMIYEHDILSLSFTYLKQLLCMISEPDRLTPGTYGYIAKWTCFNYNIVIRQYHATIISKLDYCNSLLYGVPQHLIRRLQRVQNSAARLVSGTRRREHITPTLYILHWLPVQYRVKYKVLLYAYKALHDRAPGYLCELVEKKRHRRDLRSASKHHLEVPRPRTATYGDRSFRVGAARLWNELPEDIKTIGSIPSFKRQLKTHLFKDAFIH